MPILVDRSGGVIAGHARLLAAQQIGMGQVPTIALHHLNEDQIKAYEIADNRLAELSTWDDQLLAESLQELSLLNLDFSLELTGFDMGEIDLRIEGLAVTPGEAKADPADAIAEPATGPAVTAPGDLWLLGRHRILCGSALEAESYSKLMDGQQAAMVFTDPPNNVPIKGHVSGLGRVVLIEDKASGTQLIQELSQDGMSGVTRSTPEPRMNKFMRLHAQTGAIENGLVFLPAAAEWLDTYLHEMTTFPAAKHDDQVDSTSQALHWRNTRNQAPGLLIYYERELERLTGRAP